MIASLRGEVIDKGLDYAVIECAGVGYQVQATADTLAELTRGEEAFVLTSFIVREDDQTLYAFSTPEQREMFGLLQKVSGVGARVAMAVMSVLTPVEITKAVAEGDAKTLQKAPGVGKRLADRMAVDLKGKLPELPTQPAQAEFSDIVADQQASSPVMDQVVEALTGLGFPEAKATTAVTRVASEMMGESGGETELDASALLRQSLKQLSGQRR